MWHSIPNNVVYLLNTKFETLTVCAPEGDQLFNSKARREAIEKLKSAVARHEAARNQVEQASVTLHGLRLNAATEVILDVESYVNLLANSPKEFDTSVAEFRVEVNRFQGTVSRLETQAARTTRLGAGTGAAGVTAGVGVAALGPTAAMAVATTFGTASTGTAISALVRRGRHQRGPCVARRGSNRGRRWRHGRGNCAAGPGRTCRIGTGRSGLGRVRGVSQQPQ